jgi:hypothetical protein
MSENRQIDPMDTKAYAKRLAELDARKADVWLPGDVLVNIKTLVSGAQQNYDEVDPSILLITPERIGRLSKILATAKNPSAGATLELSELDLIELRQLSYYAEQFHADFGTPEQLGMAVKDIPALTEKLRKYLETSFR